MSLQPEMVAEVLDSVRTANAKRYRIQIGPRLRHSVERAIQETKALDTPFVRLGRLEGEVAEMRGQLTELAAMVAAKLGRA